MAQILAGLLLWVSLANAALAQGPLYRERWGDLHLELLREQVQQECEDLVLMLNSGALPAPLRVLSHRVVPAAVE